MILAGAMACRPDAGAAPSPPSAKNAPAAMKAIRFHAYGDPGVLVYEDAPVPRPGAGEMLERSFKVVRPGGIIVSIVDDPSRLASSYPNVRGAGLMVKPNAGELARIATLIDEGKIKPVVSEILPLAEARRAHEMSETGHTRGKIVLRVAN